MLTLDSIHAMETAAAATLSGLRLGGYLLCEPIGSGGMGVVYRAEQTTLGRSVAVKVLHPHLCTDQSMIERFYQEARAASRLNHANSVAVIDFGVDGRRPYLVMEHLVGRSLVAHVTRDALLPVPRVCETLIDVLAALSEAHGSGVVHRDLKPENVLLVTRRSGGEGVKVVDFGLAQLAGREPGGRATDPGLCVGTPEYMAPEQFLGTEVDGRADLYAVGVLAFELIAGRTPFSSSRFSELALDHLGRRPPDLLLAAPGRATRQLARIVRRALAKARDDRFVSAAQMSSAFRSALRELRPARSQANAHRADERCSPVPDGGSSTAVPSHETIPPSAPVAAAEADIRSRRLMQAAVVLGGAATNDALLATAGETDGALIAELVFRGVLWPVASDTLVLDADVRDELEPAMPLQVRREMHDRAYEFFVEDCAPAELLLRHAEGGSDPVLALVLFEQAGDAATRRSEWTAAITAYRRGLEIARTASLRTGDEQYGDAMLTFSEKLARALCVDGQACEAEGVLREALESVEPRSSRRQRLISALEPIARLRGDSS